MEILYPICAGMDVHRDTVVTSIRWLNERGREQVETRTFGTFYDQLVELAEWLNERGVGAAGLESTGVYWKPVVRVLQERSPKIVVWLVNPAEVKQVPGRKTDVSDSQWLSKLVMHGLVSPSFLPSAEQEELRKLARFRTKLITERTVCKNRIVREMESAGIKLPSVCSDPLGVSALAMLAALLEGTKMPAEIAQLARGQLRSKLSELERAVCGSFSEASKIILRMLLERLRQVEHDLAAIDGHIQKLMERHRPEVDLLMGVPGLDRVAIAAILAEIGTDMSVFKSADHLSAWAGLAPGSCESAGKAKHAPARKGDKYLRTILVQAAWPAIRTRDCPWGQTFRRLRVRCGEMRARIAIARKMLVAIYYILRDGTPYKPQAPLPPSPEKQRRLVQRYTEQLAALGYQVALVPAAAPAA